MKRKKTKATNRIKYFLALEGKSQSWLAQELDLDYSYINKVCNHKRQPSLTLLIRVSEVLKINYKDLLE